MRELFSPQYPLPPFKLKDIKEIIAVQEKVKDFVLTTELKQVVIKLDTYDFLGESDKHSFYYKRSPNIYGDWFVVIPIGREEEYWRENK